jgi:hypothetical protein
LRQRISTIFILGLLVQVSCISAQKNLVLVADGKPNATIIISALAPAYIKTAAADLQWHIRLSSGASLPITTDLETGEIPANHVKLAVGESKITGGKISANTLKFEEFVIKTDNASKTIMMVANDGPDNPATHWAVCELLERLIDARWLWPGELGTFVTKKKTISSQEINYKWMSPFDFKFYHRVVPKEVRAWFIHHRVSKRRDLQESANQHDWHEKYYVKYPEIFARGPGGRPYTTKYDIENAKFRLDQPKFFELMVEDYQSKGNPPIYNLFPNDGGNYDALMVPGADPLKVYQGKIPLTKYYLDFYQKFDQFINNSTLNPVTRFDILAYSAYYEFPDNYTFNGKNFNVWFTDQGGDTANWAKWNKTGARMYLRPNWWHHGSLGPHITYKKYGQMVEFCKKNGMNGYRMDGYRDNWALQGLNYYVLTRQAYSSKSVDEIAREYFDAFGTASADIEQYFNLCSNNSAKFNSQFLDSIADKLNIKTAALAKAEIIPELFPEPFRKNLAITLDKASRKVTGTEKQRVEWLMAGLTISGLVNDYVSQFFTKPLETEKRAILLNKIGEIEAKYPYSVTKKSVEAVLRNKFTPNLKPPKNK